jgi:precorrin-2 methylase
VLEPGHVWLAGAGPGDPGLLTLDALAGLAQADVIVHDALVDPRVLALADPRARLEFAGKRGGRPSAVQDDISRRLVAIRKTARAYHARAERVASSFQKNTLYRCLYMFCFLWLPRCGGITALPSRCRDSFALPMETV